MIFINFLTSFLVVIFVLLLIVIFKKFQITPKKITSTFVVFLTIIIINNSSLFSTYLENETELNSNNADYYLVYPESFNNQSFFEFDNLNYDELDIVEIDGNLIPDGSDLFMQGKFPTSGKISIGRNYPKGSIRRTQSLPNLPHTQQNVLCYVPVIDSGTSVRQVIQTVPSCKGLVPLPTMQDRSRDRMVIREIKNRLLLTGVPAEWLGCHDEKDWELLSQPENQDVPGVYLWVFPDLLGPDQHFFYIGIGKEVITRITNEFKDLNSGKYIANANFQAAFKAAQQNNTGMFVFVLRDDYTLQGVDNEDTKDRLENCESVYINIINDLFKIGSKEKIYLANLMKNTNIRDTPEREVIYNNPAFWQDWGALRSIRKLAAHKTNASRGRSYQNTTKIRPYIDKHNIYVDRDERDPLYLLELEPYILITRRYSESDYVEFKNRY